MEWGGVDWVGGVVLWCEKWAFLVAFNQVFV